MLRPATPLTILMFVAFVLLVLATISTPIVKAIPIASFNGVNFGVFGYCKGSTCSKITVGYSIDLKALMGDSNANADFTLPSSTRSSLSAILIVHPVAAILTLICFILSATAHLHSPSHSPKYLLALLILIIPTLLITLLAFLVDILLFVPHLAWGGWIVLVSTILILASGIVTCAMRRTLVSRKARKKRIAENAEMNGQNYYANQMAPTLSGPRAESPPPLASGGIGNSDRLPKFATFEDSKSAIVSEDRVPLNQRTPSNKTLPSMPNEGAPRYSEDTYDRYGGPGRGGPRGAIRGGNLRGGTRGGMYGGPPRDEYGNPLPPSNGFGPAPPSGLRRDPSAPARMGGHYPDEAFAGPGFRGRGRGGYPPRGYGRGGPGSRGGGYGRGGMPMGAMAAGAGGGAIAADMRRGQPPPGYNNMYPPAGSSGRPGQYDGISGPAGFGRSPSAPAYNNRRPSPGPPSAPGDYRRRSPGPPSAARGYNRGPSPGPPSAPGGYTRGPSPGPPSAPGGYRYGPHDQGPPSPIQPYNIDSQLPPSSAPGTYPPQDAHMIGQAVEMDAVHGSPSPVPGFLSGTPPNLGESDDAGFVNLQQPPKHRDDPMSMTSVYSSEIPYVPPRAAWASSATARGTTSPLHTRAAGTNRNDAVELPVQSSLQDDPYNRKPQAQHHNRTQSDNYYEDVDPRFAATAEPIDYDTQKTRQTQSSNALPSNLMPGHRAPGPIHPTIEHNGEIVDPNDAYDDLMDGQRSPASDNSAMTSISQRGVNPNWRPGSTDGHGNLIVPQRRQQQQRDILLNSNPDFGLNPKSGGGRMPTGMGQAF